MKKQIGNRNPLVVLIGMYTGFVLVRFILAVLSSAYPIVNIDEFLYYGMARSIANGEGLMFRGQQADYSYILYPLVLSPVYLLGLKGPALYRAMQLWNILLINLSIFPIFFLAGNLLGDDRRALRITAVCMLLPDFQLGQLMMAENIIMPLFFLQFFLIHDWMKNEKPHSILLIGLIGGLLFSAKPGAVIPTAVFFILLLVRTMIKKDTRQLPWLGAGIAFTLLSAGLMMYLVNAFRGNSSILSLYKSQVAEVTHLDVFVRFLGI